MGELKPKWAQLGQESWGSTHRGNPGRAAKAESGCKLGFLGLFAKGHPVAVVGAKRGIGQGFLGYSMLRLFGAMSGAELDTGWGVLGFSVQGPSGSTGVTEAGTSGKSWGISLRECHTKSSAAPVGAGLGCPRVFCTSVTR